MSSAKSQIFLIHGADSRASWYKLQAIRNRFLTHSGSMPDLTELDLTEVTGAVLEQSMLSVPFFVTHRLFILKSPFSAPKTIQEKLVDLLPKIAPSTVVVFFEPQQADGRTKLWQLLKLQGTVYSHDIPEGAAARAYILELARSSAVTIDSGAVDLLMVAENLDTWKLEHEIRKIAAYCLSKGQAVITRQAVEEIGSLSTEVSVFGLTDSVRDGKLVQSIRLLKQLEVNQDPMALAGMVATVPRNLAKIVLAGTDQSAQSIARLTGLHPYVATLTLSVAKKQTRQSILAAYDSLIKFETDVKTGLLPSSLALLLLIIRLGDSLNKGYVGRTQTSN